MVWTGSVALLGDALHNMADALTAVPLGVAFLIGRRAANRRYTYGYGRAEDLAGIFIVALIAASSAAAGYQAVHRLLHPGTVSTCGRSALRSGRVHRQRAGRPLPHHHRQAYRLGRPGRRRTARPYRRLHVAGRSTRCRRCCSRLAVGRSYRGAGHHRCHPIVLKDAARQIYHRLMDAVDPDLIDQAETTLRATPGVREIGPVRLRWIGHSLRAECALVVDPDLSVGRPTASPWTPNTDSSTPFPVSVQP